MTQQTIRIGSAPNDKTGDPLRTAFAKVNANFTELYAGGANETQLTNGSYTLTLGSTGTLTLPGAAGHQTTFGSAGAIGDVLASVDDLVLKSKKSVTISSGEDIGALQTNYTNKLGLLSNALTAGNWNGVGTPASYTSYAALAAAKPSNPLILDNWLVLANEVLIAYNAWQAVLNASLVAIGVGDNGWGFGTSGSLTFPDATVQTTAYTGLTPNGTKAANATGTAGQISWDANYIYVCTATNTWKRSPLTGAY